MAKKNSSNQELADQLLNWTKKYRCENELTTALAKSILEKRDLYKWADLDPFNFLPYPTHQKNTNRLRLIERLTILRNVLVFSPVALTWAAVSEATSAFEKYTSENDTAVVNFLEFWQNGYGVLATFWHLADVARLAVVIIAIVILLTFYTSFQGQKIADTEVAELQKLDTERQILATNLALFLADKKKITNVTFNQAIANSVQRLQSAASSLDTSSKEIYKASKKLPKIDK